ncbi:MAG TPA: hypothetical protein VHH36_08375 [Candidatus Thermoplasmatota archaeon]|nr:hypothetical protein [Candidatus Thermoplasmatota archaeon]
MRGWILPIVAALLTAGCAQEAAHGPEPSTAAAADDDAPTEPAPEPTPVAPTPAPRPNASANATAPPAPRPNATAPPGASTKIGEVDHAGQFDVLVFSAFFLSGPATRSVWTDEFPAGYRQAVLTLAWNSTAPTNDVLSLMLHRKGEMGSDGMVAEVSGTSPLRLVVDAGTAPPGEWDVTVFVPMDGSVPLVVQQPFDVHVEWWSGDAPPAEA